MTLEEIEKALTDYKAALDRKAVIVTKQLQGYTITGDDLEFLMTGFYEQEHKFEQISPEAIRLLLPIAKAAKAFTAQSENYYKNHPWYYKYIDDCYVCMACDHIEDTPHADDCAAIALDVAVKQLEGQSDE